MKPPLVLGVIVSVLGLIFSLQGFDILKGSAMSNTTTWSVLGPIILIVGVAMVVLNRRGTKRE